MLSLRLITSGLNPDVHSVIGFELGYADGTESYLLQPRDGTSFDYSAMHDVNRIKIPELIEVGKDRWESLDHLFSAIIDQDVLVWYSPFIKAFMVSIKEELKDLGLYGKCDFILVDLMHEAKNKALNTSNLQLATVYRETGTSDLFELYEYLKALPEPTTLRRV